MSRPRTHLDADGVLHDPDLLAVARAIDELAARELLTSNAGRVLHFVQRLAANDDPDGARYVIVVIDVDDALGRVFADATMPGADWQPYRDRGEVPIARGLAEREGIAEMLAALDPPAADQLRAISGPAVVVVARGVAVAVAVPT